MSLRDIEYIAKKILGDKKKANSIIMDAYTLCSKVVSISSDAAINSIYEDYKGYEDELLIQTAKEEMVDAIVTNNIKDFENRGVPVFTPKNIITSVTFINV